MRYDRLGNVRLARELMDLLKLEAQDISQSADYALATSCPSEYDENDWSHDMGVVVQLDELVKLLKAYVGDDDERE